MTTAAGEEKEDLRETHGNRRKVPNDDRETRERRRGGMTNFLKMSECECEKGGTPESTLRSPTTR
jgi:hypothetical protein